MRVHLLAPAGYRDHGTGGNVYDRHLVRCLRERGWNVVVHEIADGGPVPTFSTSDLVVVDSLVASWSAGALLAGDGRVVPLVHMLFGTPGERELLAAAAAVVTTSAWTRDRVVALGADPRRVHVAVPGADRGHATGGTAGGTRLLCVGSVSRTKGQDVLVAALARLTDLDWHGTFVGAWNDLDLLDELRKSAADAGITDRIELTGPLTPDLVRAAYENHDLAVLPSRAESYGMAITEALARGLPVVASSVGGTREALGTVRGQHPGMLVRAADPDALATALRRWLTDAPLRAWLRRTATERIATLPSWAGTAAHVSQALGSVP